MTQIDVTVAVFKTKNAAINFINKHPELKISDTVTISQREVGDYAVIEYIWL